MVKLPMLGSVLTYLNGKIRIKFTDSSYEDVTIKWGNKPRVSCTVCSLIKKNILKIGGVYRLKYSKHLTFLNINLKQTNVPTWILSILKTEEDGKEKDFVIGLMINSNILWVVNHVKKVLILVIIIAWKITCKNVCVSRNTWGKQKTF